MEGRADSIATGRSADRIMLVRNTFRVPITGLDPAQVLTAILNGKVVYKK